MELGTIRLTLGRDTLSQAKRLRDWYGKSCSITSLVRRSLELLEDELVNLDGVDAQQIERGNMTNHLAPRPVANLPR